MQSTADRWPLELVQISGYQGYSNGATAMSDPTTTDEADAQGYTRQVIIDGEDYPVGLGAFVKPHADTDGTFRAFDSDHQCMVTIEGSKVEVRDVD